MPNIFPSSFECQMNDLKRDINVLAQAILKAGFTDYDQYLLMDILFEKTLKQFRKPLPVVLTYVLADKLFSLSSFAWVHRIFGNKPIQNPKTLTLALESFVKLAKAGVSQYYESAVTTGRTLISLLTEFGQEHKYVASPFRHWYDLRRNLCYNKSSPNIYLTAICAKALLSLAGLDHSFLASSIEIANFLVLPQCYVKLNDHIFYKYFVGGDTLLVHNANTAVGSFLIQLSRHVNDGSQYGEIGSLALNSTLEEIGYDGTLSYFSKSDVRYSPRIIDNFHTGFVICDLIDAYNSAPDESYEEYICKLLRFYSKMFDKSGCPSHSPWRRYPIDIHDCAVGILTFSKASCLDKKLLNSACTIYERTRELLQDDDGLFFCQRHPLVRHKGKFLRWNQAWMLFALSALVTARA